MTYIGHYPTFWPKNGQKNTIIWALSQKRDFRPQNVKKPPLFSGAPESSSIAKRRWNYKNQGVPLPLRRKSAIFDPFFDIFASISLYCHFWTIFGPIFDPFLTPFLGKMTNYRIFGPIFDNFSREIKLIGLFLTPFFDIFASISLNCHFYTFRFSKMSKNPSICGHFRPIFTHFSTHFWDNAQIIEFWTTFYPYIIAKGP